MTEAEIVKLLVMAHCIVSSLIGAGQLPNTTEYGRQVAAIGANTVQAAQTDLTGKAEFRDIPAGKYYVYGAYVWGSADCTSWNVPVEISAGTQTLVLDQHNGWR